MTASTKAPTLVPASEAALRLACTRETLIRRIQRGSVRGVFRDGRWFVDARDLGERAGEKPA